jgi:uracil-DNA glycosylase family 4
VDAKELLRRYLEQRREMGESELVLDRMSVEEAMGLLTGGRDARPAGSPDSPLATRKPNEPAASPAPSIPAQEPALPTREVGDSQLGSDWRAALRATGASPETTAKKSRAADESRGQTSGDAGSSGNTQSRSIGEPAPALSDASIARLASLDEIAKQVATCTRCPLYATATNPVPGEGNAEAGFMCVGEAPGATEDETGRPFIGAAGQLLTKILGAIGLQREDVYICNVLKHRPPGNRNPMPNEVQACSPYLIRQIELVRPKVILALGTFAAQTLLDTKTPIGKLRGQVHQYLGVPLVVTYHPAALLRNPSWKRPTWEDVQLAHRILTGATDPKSGA